MAGSKTKATDVAVTEFLSQVEPERRRSDARRLDQVFREASGFAPRMWGPSIIGYGRYHYKYESARGVSLPPALRHGRPIS